MQILLMIQTIPHLQSQMLKGFREKIYNNRHMTVGRLRADGILNLLREFENQETISTQTFQKRVNFANAQSFNTLSSREQEIAEMTANRLLANLDKPNLESYNTSKHDHFFQYHGPRSNHTTEQCRGGKKTGYGNGKFFNTSISPGRSPGRDIPYHRRSQSFDRYSSPNYNT